MISLISRAYNWLILHDLCPCQIGRRFNHPLADKVGGFLCDTIDRYACGSVWTYTSEVTDGEC